MEEAPKTVYPEQSSVEGEIEFKLDKIHDRIMQFGIIQIGLLVLILLALLVSGCAMFEHEDAAGNVTRYFRLGNQSIGEGNIRLADGSVLNFEKQESTVPVLVIEIPGAKVKSGGKQ